MIYLSEQWLFSIANGLITRETYPAGVDGYDYFTGHYSFTLMSFLNRCVIHVTADVLVEIQ
jgi:hypothetical protein